MPLELQEAPRAVFHLRKKSQNQTTERKKILNYSLSLSLSLDRGEISSSPLHDQQSYLVCKKQHEARNKQAEQRLGVNAKAIRNDPPETGLGQEGRRDSAEKKRREEEAEEN